MAMKKTAAKPAAKPVKPAETAEETSSAAKPRAPRKTEKVNIFLPPDQLAWLKSKKNLSETVRALITEAMALENLAKSVKKKR